MNNNFNIEQFLSLENYANDTRVDRRKGAGGTAEYFTPYTLVKKMADKIPIETWSNPNADFLEPSFGNGNFIIYIIYNKIQHGSTWEQALFHTWGVELMEDNVKETHQRVLTLLDNLNINYDKNKALNILKHNLVCSDFFNWDYENWEPIKEYKAEPLF